MTQELKEQIARNAASGWCRCFKCDGTVRNTNSNTKSQCDKDKLITCNQWYDGYKTALLALDDERISNLWKDAQGEDLPEIDREVIALVGLCGSFEIQNEEPHILSYKVVFAHRPPKHWDGKNILTGEVTRYTPKTYDKGEWNIPNVKWWLDLELPKMEN